MFESRTFGSRGLFVLAVVLALTSSMTFATGRLVGKAVDAEGNPLEGVRVKMIPVDADLPVIEVESKKTGKFVFGLLRPARYRLVAFKDGMRISRIDANLAVPEDESLWSFHDNVPPGTEMPTFRMTGVTNVTYDLVFSESAAGPGEYGTGVPVSPTSVIVELLQGGKLDEALGEVGRTLEAYPDNATLHYLKGFALMGLGREDEAVAAANKTLELQPGFEGANLLVAKVLENQGKLDEALAAYEREGAVAKSTEVLRDLHIGRASVFIKQDRLEDAAAALEQVIAIDPANTGALTELADIYVRVGNQERASEMLEKVSSLGEADPNVLYNMGAERYNAGELEAAADYFRRALEIKPDFADAHRQLAFTQLSLGDREQAIEHLKQYLELNPDEQDQHVQSAKAILQQLTEQN